MYDDRGHAGDPGLAEAGASGSRGGGAFVVGLALPVGAAILYELAFRFGIFEARLLPPPSRVGLTLWKLAASGELQTHIVATMVRVVSGFGIGALAGILLGALTGSSAAARVALDPTLQALRAIPSLAWVPLFILWLGIFETSKIALIALGCFFPVYLGVMGAIANVDRKIVAVGRAFRLARPALARRILLPAILPDTIVALRSAIGLGFMFVVAAELMGASEGLGYLLLDGQQLGKPDQILAAILCFAILGKICDWLIVIAARPFMTWQDSHAREG